MGNPGYDVSEVTLSKALPNHALVLTLLTCGSGRLVGNPSFTRLGKSARDAGTRVVPPGDTSCLGPGKGLIPGAAGT